MKPVPDQAESEPSPAEPAAPPAAHAPAGTSPQLKRPPVWNRAWFRATLGLAIVGGVCGVLVWQMFPGWNGLASDYYARRGINSLAEGDAAAALTDMDAAVAWAPDSARPYFERAQVRRYTKDTEGALADLDRAIAINPYFATAYQVRSTIRQEKGNHAQAIADLSRIVELRPTGSPEPLNARAYARALAGVELPAALEDAEQAIALTSPQDFERSGRLDTRGFVLYKLGRHVEALADLNAAVAGLEAALPNLQPDAAPAQEASWKEMQAVLHYHRALILQALDRQTEADRDLVRVRELGHEPGPELF